MSFRILLADSDSATLAGAESALVEAGYGVASVGTFEEATQQLSLAYPDMLVTAVRLGAFNGLHLMFRCRAEHSDLPVIVVGASRDFTPDMLRYATRFVTTPIDRAGFVGLVSELLAGRTPHDHHSARRWPRERALLPAIIHRSAARVVELSYGGLRLEMPAAPGDVRAPIAIGLPSLGLSVNVIVRWSKPVGDIGAWWCGAEIKLAGSGTTGQWRYLVDSLN